MATRSIINRLISQINKYPKLSDAKGCFEKFPITLKDLCTVKIPEKNYARHLLHADTKHAIVCIGWKANSYTNYHQHPSNGCLFKVLSGSILELRNNKCTIYKPLNEKNDITKIGDGISIINDAGYIDNTVGKHYKCLLQKIP